MVYGTSLRGRYKRQDGLRNARSKMSMSPSWVRALPLCKEPHLSSSTNPIKAVARHSAPLAIWPGSFCVSAQAFDLSSNTSSICVAQGVEV